MKTREDLVDILHGIDGRGYKAYKQIRGSWRFEEFTLVVDHVQGDPFAAPSRVRVLLEPGAAALPPEVLESSSRRIGVACLLARRFDESAAAHAPGSGSGKSGEIRIEAPGQEVYRQTAVQVTAAGSVEARFTVGLPARGRTVLGRAAAELLGSAVPRVVDRSLRGPAHDPEGLRSHAETNEDADALRAALDGRGLVAFLADGAVLPRSSGVDQLPLAGPDVVPFRSPESLRVTLEAPNGGPVDGLGIPAGVTLIVGGGYHGKSTLLRALERGVYNHRPGDGRERVVTIATAVKIRAEDGRAVSGVDISPFIDNLPLGEDTGRFVSRNASGSTSQAAGIMEAVEAGARLLLIDEDTSATNFMIRDRRMQALVESSLEPITPFVDRVRQLHREMGVSTVVVLGGSGDYLDVADHVVAMRRYRPGDVTEEARRVARELPTGRTPDPAGPLRPPAARIPEPSSLDPRRGRRDVSVRVRGPGEIEFGRTVLDLSAVEQIVSRAQMRAIGDAMVLARERGMDGRRTLPEVLERVMELVATEGLDVLDARAPGDLAEFRGLELAAALNRLRTLRVRTP